MSLFGDKCARCGHNTRHKVNDSPMCEHCERETALLVAAGTEDSRTCPVDGGIMAKEVAHMIVIDRCPRCQGVWLDGGELERLKGGVEAEAILAMANGFTVPLA